MFGWLKRKQRNEILKLLYQNRSFLNVHCAVYSNDNDAKEWEKELDVISQCFFENGELDRQKIDKLLKINRTARIFYDENDPEMKLYRGGYLSKKPQSFDDKYKPMLGWKEYYSNY